MKGTKTFAKSKTGKTIIVAERTYDALGLPTSNKIGVIRPAEGSDLDLIIDALESGDVQFEFSAVQNKDNGIYEMERVAVGELVQA